MKIGIDLGGSHIAVGIVDDNGKIIIKKEKDIVLKNKINIKVYIVDTIVNLIDEILNEENIPISKIEKIGVAVPGKTSKGIIKDLHNLGIKELELEKILKQYYKIEISIMNDAKCAAMAERKYGSLKNIENEAVFLCLGTGIGGATFYKGQLVKPHQSEASEFGHMIIQKDGIECNCGNKGCFERYASIKAFKNEVRKILNEKEGISSKDLLEKLNQNINNIEIEKYIDTYIDYLLVGISNIVNIIEPEVICIGGGFVYYKEILYTKLIERMKLKKYKFNNPKIVLADLGNDAGMIGATLI